MARRAPEAGRRAAPRGRPAGRGIEGSHRPPCPSSAPRRRRLGGDRGRRARSRPRRHRHRKLKPLILRVRQAPQFVARDDIRDSNVFANREFLYGVDARHNVGYGFWQMAYGSKQALTPAAYAAARAQVMGCRGDGGRPLGLVPDLLVVPPALEGAARQILEAEYLSATESNVWRGSARLLVTPWLA